MSVASLTTNQQSNHIRRVNPSSDLDQIADLIEICFPIQFDQDGKYYIQEMRRAARDLRMLGWISTLSEMGTLRASGFVWEENGQIIGNLSLIPFQIKGRQFHMIANVAVHPLYRQRGIARALTDRALYHLRKQKDNSVWLQVRDDNPAAIELYRSVGFKDQTVRTTWRIRPVDFHPITQPVQTPLIFRCRKKSDWKLQLECLAVNYPQSIRWNLPVEFHRLNPGLVQVIVNYLDGETFKHWSIESDGKCCGVITWQKTNRYANNLWLSFPEEGEELYLPGALNDICKHLPKKHPLSIDYPKGRYEDQFITHGFEKFRTLIWMQMQF